jgi:hypothetical protein
MISSAVHKGLPLRKGESITGKEVTISVADSRLLIQDSSS